ncbi:MAG: GNAT family N-acetyltransferase [Candidatus Anstonellales archaeon]
MEQIAKCYYNKLIEPLQGVTINNLFARSVIEQKVSGKVFVDNINNPRTFYIVHSYGMSLLFGDCNNIEFNNKFKEYALNSNFERNKFEWIQAFPGDWDFVLSDLFSNLLIKSSDNIEKKEQGIIELNTRVNFKSNVQKYAEFKFHNNHSGLHIVRSEKHIFQDMKGSVVPSSFWDSADDFFENGIGFSLFYENKLASTAFSAFIHDDKLEIGIETIEAFRGKGFVKYVCSSLIDYCLENGYEPIWSCRKENINSYKLAQKLGFEPIKEIPFYRLSM